MHCDRHASMALLRDENLTCRSTWPVDGLERIFSCSAGMSNLHFPLSFSRLQEHDLLSLSGTMVLLDQ